MHDTNPLLAPVFFVLFVFFVYFVLLSLFIAIINHAYITIQERGAYGHELSLAGYLFEVFLTD